MLQNTFPLPPLKKKKKTEQSPQNMKSDMRMVSYYFKILENSNIDLLSMYNYIWKANNMNYQINPGIKKKTKLFYQRRNWGKSYQFLNFKRE